VSDIVGDEPDILRAQHVMHRFSWGNGGA
jgi:hypothetical protein